MKLFLCLYGRMTKTPTPSDAAHRQIRDFGEDRRDWIRHVISQGDIPENYRLIAVAIALRINHRTEESWPSTKTIALETATSVRTVIRGINFLNERGLLKITRRKRGGNRYEMILPWR